MPDGCVQDVCRHRVSAVEHLGGQDAWAERFEDLLHAVEREEAIVTSGGDEDGLIDG
jgi:hypothetical protein